MLSLADKMGWGKNSVGVGERSHVMALPLMYNPQGLDFAILHATTRVTQATLFKAPLWNRQQVSALKFGV